MSNTAGIYIKVGDDSVGDYATKYLSDLPDYQVWPDQEVLAWLIRSIEGLYTYHEERQQDALPGMTEQDMESRKAQGWLFAPEIDLPF